jgi:PilZ domain/TOBE domain
MTGPDLHSTVTLSTADGRTVRARVEHAKDDDLTLRTSSARRPAAIGDEVTLHWPAGPRGRFSVKATVLERAGERLVVAMAGSPQLEQLRRFVRGGGGEKVWVRPPGSAHAVSGCAQDLSEQGLRARFEGRQAQPGQKVHLLIELDDRESVEVVATVLDSRVDNEVEVVFSFEPDEPQAQAIRRHVLRRQMQARARVAEG